MQIFRAALVVLYGLMLWYQVRTGLAEYAAFKLLTETSDRQKHYRGWLLRSFLFNAVSGFAGLMVLGRWRAMANLPDEFRGLYQTLQASLLDLNLNSGFLAGFGVSLCIGIALGGVIAARLARKGRSLFAGDIQPIMPRNSPETGYTMLLSLNAGFSEELLFRLCLPLLLTILTGNAIFAFLCAGIVFGAMHVYQGPLGVVATMVIGFVLTFLYLSTANIWIAMAFHAGIDVLGLVVRPTIFRWIKARKVGASVEAY